MAAFKMASLCALRGREKVCRLSAILIAFFLLKNTFFLSLASLLTMTSQEACKWLKNCRERGKLRTKSLRKEKDLESVRHLPWFKELEQSLMAPIASGSVTTNTGTLATWVKH